MSDTFGQDRLPWMEDDDAVPSSPAPKKPRTNEDEDKDTPSRLIPLELERSQGEQSFSSDETDPTLPARWEDLREEAESRDVFSVIVEKLRAVPAYHQLAKLISLAKNEGYVWVVFGQPGSGKSAFFQTLEQKFRSKVSTFIINGNNWSFANSDGSLHNAAKRQRP